MAGNTLAALTAYDALGLPLDRAQEGVSRVAISPWRGETTELPGGGFVVNDAYNANPTSMRAALIDLCRARGRAAPGRHPGRDGGARRRLRPPTTARSAALLAELGVDVLVAVGTAARDYLEPGVDEMRWLPAAEGFDDLLQPGDAILVKASRAVGLEGVPSAIAKVAERWSES